MIVRQLEVFVHPFYYSESDKDRIVTLLPPYQELLGNWAARLKVGCEDPNTAMLYFSQVPQPVIQSRRADSEDPLKKEFFARELERISILESRWGNRILAYGGISEPPKRFAVTWSASVRNWQIDKNTTAVTAFGEFKGQQCVDRWGTAVMGYFDLPYNRLEMPDDLCMQGTRFNQINEQYWALDGQQKQKLMRHSSLRSADFGYWR